MAEIVNKNPVNDPTQKSVKTHSKFTPDFSAPITHKFGVNTPLFGIAGVADDDISLRVQEDTDTYTLKAPLMVPLKRNMDYFQLPLRALLPNAAELIITNPLQGDDIDAEKANAVLTPSELSQLQGKVMAGVNVGYAAASSMSQFVGWILRSYQMYQMICSHGALPKYLGYSCFSHIKARIITNVAGANKTVDVETLYDALFQLIDDYVANNEGYIEITTRTLKTDVITTGSYPFNPQSDTRYIWVGRAFNRQSLDDSGSGYHYDYVNNMRELANLLVELNAEISSVDLSYLGGNPTTGLFPNIAATDSALLFAAKTLYAASLGTITNLELRYPILKHNINLLKLVAYQKACAEFYTNDKVDAIYSAALYEQNQLTIARYLAAVQSTDNRFSINGVGIEYDSCSGMRISDAVNVFVTTSGSLTTNDLVAFAYLHNLFAFTRSLKYEDYFVGAKTQPLAVGDVTVGVDTGDNTVDIIDVSKKIQVQRFLNQVNRIGRKFSDYVKGILGDKPMKDVHEPIFLGHVVDTIGAEETDNTGDGQLSLENSTTSKFRNNANRFAFDVHVGEPSILIGIVNYDIVRAYAYLNDRENYHVDRYDAFNPFMQFVGDQEVYKDELLPRPSDTNPFGYTMRYMEYKQRVDRAAGGFSLGVLPGYAKILQPDEIPENINSDFLRSHVGDIDEFYQVLSGYAPGSRFNFIVRLDVGVTANRPMAFAPSIL